MNHTAFAALVFALFLPNTIYATDIERLKLPAGFTISALDSGLEDPRQLALADDGTLYVGTRRGDSVIAIPNALTDPGKPIEVVDGLTMPNGVAIHGGDLFIGALTRVLVFRNIGERLGNPGKPEVLTDKLPNKRHHGWRYLRFGPDGYLYIPVGAPCNICLESDPRFASILKMDPVTGATTVYASGVRNSVGMAFHPETKELWFTDNGGDRLGDDVPAEEINRVPASAALPAHFGYPFIHQGDLPDPEFGASAIASAYLAPEIRLTAHSAALGLLFYQGKQFPPQYRGGLFVAQHGSWNRSKKSGYQVMFLRQNDSGWTQEPFITGWLNGQKNWGRPVDLVAAPDGSLLISDDQSGTIYRVTYSGR